MRLRSIALGVLAAGALLALSAAPASAAPALHHRHHHHHHHGGCGDINQVSAGNYGLLNGTQIALPVNVGLDLSHNALGLLGGASSYGDSGNDFC